MKKYCLFLVLTIAILALFGAVDAFAANNAVTFTTGYADENDLARVVCNGMELFTGGVGKTFAAFAVISLGIGFFMGKISWGLMVATGMGIAIMFGAPSIVSALLGETAFECTKTNPPKAA